MNHQRMPNDFYPTSAALTHLLLKYHPISEDWRLFEPCKGQGHISNHLADVGYSVECSDISYEDGRNRDASSKEFWSQRNVDFTITNPPYNLANEIVPLAYENSTYGCAMLLRLTWLEPTKARADFLKKAPLTKLIIVNPRPRFRSDTKATDSVTSAWMVWDKRAKSNAGTQITYATDWRKP